MPRLYILSGADIGKSVDVADGATIGRTPECAVHLRDASVSRHHARIERAAEGWKIVDTQSRNGVSFLGERVAAVALNDGDEFQVGDVHLRFRFSPGEQPAKPEVANPDVAKPEMEEISLEEEEPIAIPAPAPARVERVATPLERTVASQPRPGEPEQRGARILQYKKIQDREGFFASDLAQQPLWIKFGAALLALALFGAIFLFAFKGTSFLKSRASAEPAEAPEEPSR
jgi:pSer/pThr/pTyr-binding forkhead associated (FHA) protein